MARGDLFVNGTDLPIEKLIHDIGNMTIMHKHLHVNTNTHHTHTRSHTLVVSVAGGRALRVSLTGGVLRASLAGPAECTLVEKHTYSRVRTTTRGNRLNMRLRATARSTGNG